MALSLSYRLTAWTLSIFIGLLLFAFLPLSWNVVIALGVSASFTIYQAVKGNDPQKRYLLGLLFVAIFLVIIGFVLAIEFGLLPQVGSGIQLVWNLYQHLFPYSTSFDFVAAVGWTTFFYMLLFGFFVIIVFIVTKISHLYMLVSLAWFLSLFTAYFLLFNVIFYLIPPLKDAILSNTVLAWVLGFIYGIVPFLIMVFLIYTLLTITDLKERHRLTKDAAQLNKHTGRRFRLILKGAAIAFVIAVIITLIVAVMP